MASAGTFAQGGPPVSRQGKAFFPRHRNRSALYAGHTAGSCCYYFPAEKLLFSGDTLFERSFGRVDLPGGNMASLKRSLDRLFALPADTLVLPGHMGQTSIGEERKSNPIFYY